MNFFTKYALLITTLFITSCATITSDIEVETHVHPDTNFNAYKSYAWLGSAQIVFDPIGQWEQPTLDTDEEVRFAINRELRARNIIPVEKDPDLLIAFAAGIDASTLELTEHPDNDENVLATVPKAALVIALVDAKSGYAVWIGYASGDVQQQQTIETIQARINYAVNELFKQL